MASKCNADAKAACCGGAGEAAASAQKGACCSVPASSGASCCPGGPSKCTTAVSSACCQQPADDGQQKPHEVVKEYYGKVLATSKDLKTNACTTGDRPVKAVRDILAKVPRAVSEKFYGCGSPLPLGIEGLRVLDLGSGSGRDCYVAAALVGQHGSVVGVDMTDEQLDVARAHADAFCTQTLGFPTSNLTFRKGLIEFLDRAGIEDESTDMIISNCVVNLSPDKAQVLKEAYRVLAPGGEMYFSDVYCDRRLPKELLEHEVLFGECISGALYVEDFVRLANQAGFADPRVLSAAPLTIDDDELRELTGQARFCSITYRLFKVPGELETKGEDYGQLAKYKGTIEGYRNAYALDQGFTFETNRFQPVDGNTASILQRTWLAKHFEVLGDRSVHYGLFQSQPQTKVQWTSAKPAASASGGCCG